MKTVISYKRTLILTVLNCGQEDKQSAQNNSKHSWTDLAINPLVKANLSF